MRDHSWLHIADRIHRGAEPLPALAAFQEERKLADTQLYPQRYLDGSREIHTRFEVGHGTPRSRDENKYGLWVPGDARDALIAVVLGGPRESVLQGLHDVSRHVELDFAW
jgi:hypothetical protein